MTTTTSAATRPAAAPNGFRCSDPGWAISSTPTKPTSTADQRHDPTRSRRITAVTSTAKNGLVNESTLAWGKVSRIVAPNTEVMPRVLKVARKAWLLRRDVRNRCNCPLSARTASITGIVRACRQNSSSGSAIPFALANLTSAMSTATQIVARRRIQIARNERSDAFTRPLYAPVLQRQRLRP